MGPAEDYPFGGDCRCGLVIFLLMTESPHKTLLFSFSRSHCFLGKNNVVFYFWLMLTEDCTCYSKNEVIAFITNSCLNLQNYNNITCEQLVVTAVTSNAHTALDS